MNAYDKFLYEERPYIYGLMGVLAIYFSDKSKLALVSGFVLIACAVVILLLRREHRERNKILDAEHAKFTAEKKSNSLKNRI